MALELFGRQDGPGQQGGEEHHHEERWQQPAEPALVETEDGEPPLVHAPGDDAGDQEARDHEEHIDPDEATREPGETRMEEEHGEHGDGS